MTTQQALDTPPVKWAELAESMTARELDRLATELAGLAAGAAMLAAYLEYRNDIGCLDQGHDSAVKHCNKVAAKVRLALGYSITHNLNF